MKYTVTIRAEDGSEIEITTISVGELSRSLRGLAKIIDARAWAGALKVLADAAKALQTGGGVN